MDTLPELGVCIDSIDDCIVELLARRMHLARRAGDVKRREKIPLRRPAIEEQRIARVVVLAKQKNIDPKFVTRTWTLFIEEAVRLQETGNPAPGKSVLNTKGAGWSP